MIRRFIKRTSCSTRERTLEDTVSRANRVTKKEKVKRGRRFPAKERKERKRKNEFGHDGNCMIICVTSLFIFMLLELNLNPFK
jgi:hypothetical protein